jgi:hypothetical protein
MGLGMILDDVCVYIGVIVVWMVKGGKYSLCDKLSEVKAFDFLRRREGIIGLATIIAISGLCGLFMHFLDKLQTIAVHFVIGTQKFMRKFRGRFICLQSARGLAQSKTLRVFQESSCCAQRLGVRWPSTAFPSGKSNCANVDRNCHRALPEAALAFQSAPIHPVIDFRPRLAGRLI